MFVLDALRRIKGGKLTIPSFHLGHLGFRPGLEVNSYYGPFDDGRGHELTLTPFQGSRDDLFIFKCVFKEQPGVVAKALSAFASMKLNVLSLESGTIDRDTKHVLFCILSWAPVSRYLQPIHLDDGTKHKFIDLLPLLPTLDKRYVYLLEMVFSHCFDAVEFERVPGTKRNLPRISIKLFDDFHVRLDQRHLKISRKEPTEVPDARFSLPSVQVDLASSGAKMAPELNSPALLFSETETKTLHVIFPKVGRDSKFLHIGFTHVNWPGALLVIAKLVQACGFSIKTSLLRQHERDINVWEIMLEYVGPASIDVIPEGKKGVVWFGEWCFGEKNPNSSEIRQMVQKLHEYKIDICRPSYPRYSKDTDGDFESINFLERIAKPEVASDGPALDVDDEERATLAHLREIADTQPESKAWVAKLLYPATTSRSAGWKGQVFVSMPFHFKAYLESITTKFRTGLNLEVITYLRPDLAENIGAKTVEKIRAADFFLGIWHPEKEHASELSPWMPFEYGVAKALGKPCKLIAHRDIPKHIASRINRDYALSSYDDDNFDSVISEAVGVCRREWVMDER